jgi:hypothetical protein
MSPRRLAPFLFALALVSSAAACSSAASTPAPPAPSAPPASSASSATGACTSAPAVASSPGWGIPATTPKLVPYMVSNNIACGKARMLFLFLDSANKVVSAPDRTAKVRFFNLGRDPDKAVTEADGAFVWTIKDDRGMYVVDADLPEAGTWGAEFTTEAPGSPAETARLTFSVVDSTPTVRVGQKAPASKTPTAAGVGGDLTKISTDAHPDPAFYQTSVADALATHKPFLLVFATPKFCASQQCGPTLDQLKPIAAAHRDVTFINVEPYQLKFADGSLQADLDANNQLQATDVTDQWGLLSEPWIFAVDRDGVVRGSYEVMITPAELDAILPVLTKGG